MDNSIPKNSPENPVFINTEFNIEGSNKISYPINFNQFKDYSTNSLKNKNKELKHFSHTYAQHLSALCFWWTASTLTMICHQYKITR